jgi:hypothetical protein
VVNSLNAACEEGYVPDTLCLLVNPKVTDQVGRITALSEAIVEAYGGGELDVRLTYLEEETDFGGVVDHYRDAIAGARDGGERVAVDVTPGRKYMSAIAFQAGIQFEADHVFYLLVESNRYYSLLYPEIPRSGLDLIDFAEELA